MPHNELVDIRVAGLHHHEECSPAVDLHLTCRLPSSITGALSCSGPLDRPVVRQVERGAIECENLARWAAPLLSSVTTSADTVEVYSNWTYFENNNRTAENDLQRRSAFLT